MDSKNATLNPAANAQGHYGDDFPSSHRVLVPLSHDGYDLQVPKRRIHLSNGEAVDVYDTTGPGVQDGIAASEGLPPVRAPWIEARKKLGAENVTQMQKAQKA